MRTSKTFISLTVVLLLTTGCTSEDIDKGGDTGNYGKDLTSFVSSDEVGTTHSDG